MRALRQAAFAEEHSGRLAQLLRQPPVVPKDVVATVEAQVIPRLQLAHGMPLAGAAARPAPTGRDILILVRLLVAHDTAGAAAHVAALRNTGMALERIFLDLFGPVAAQLGQLWADDGCDFATVTLGLVLLRRLHREYAVEFLKDARPRVDGRRILLAVAPGSQHGFGLDLVADFFRRSGWDVTCAGAARPAELRQALQREPFQIVGFSVSTSAQLDPLAALIRCLRRESRNRRIGIMVGGPVLLDRPDRVASLGADAMATDARQAPLQAERLLALMAPRG